MDASDGQGYGAMSKFFASRLQVKCDCGIYARFGELNQTNLRHTVSMESLFLISSTSHVIFEDGFTLATLVMNSKQASVYPWNIDYYRQVDVVTINTVESEGMLN